MHNAQICVCVSECVKVVDPLAITAIKASICNAI